MNKYIDTIIKEAEKSLKKDDVPVGAIVVKNGKIIAKAYNTREESYKITGHAEINAVEKACKKLKTWHLSDCELYVTLEPCKMCKEIIKQARIQKVYYCAKQEKDNNLKNPIYEQIDDQNRSKEMLKKFFKNKRK